MHQIDNTLTIPLGGHVVRLRVRWVPPRHRANALQNLEWLRTLERVCNSDPATVPLATALQALLARAAEAIVVQFVADVHGGSITSIRELVAALAGDVLLRDVLVRRLLKLDVLPMAATSATTIVH